MNDAPAFYNTVKMEIILKSGAKAEYVVEPFRSNPLSYSASDSDDRKKHLDAAFSASALTRMFLRLIAGATIDITASFESARTAGEMICINWREVAALTVKPYPNYPDD